MKLDIKSLHFELKKEDHDYVAEKVSHLDRYYKNIISGSINIICDHEDTKGNTYLLDGLIKVPGKDIFAKSQSRDIRSGIDDLEEKLKLQMVKSKSKKDPKRLARAAKWVKDFWGKGSA